jgi:hypothetical protein
MNGTIPLVLQGKIPWENLKGAILEECIYWLLHSMGARDLQWRIGGAGQGAADGGRDLEATFYLSGPDGDLTPQKWWVDAKGRKRTVEKAAVMAAAHNAQGIDVLVIATNAVFSNPTIDWVKDWNSQNKGPKVQLWDRSKIERLLCSHPDVVGRLFSQALSPQGRLEMLRAQFWNHGIRAESSLLKRLWVERKQLNWDTRDRIAVIASEFANGNITERAWGSTLGSEDIMDVFKSALINGPGTFLRLHKAGHGLAEYYEFLAYLLLNMLIRFKTESVAEYMDSVWKNCEIEFSKDIQEMVIGPMVYRLEQELFDLCMSDCFRVTAKPNVLNARDVKDYWERLRVRDVLPKIEKESLFMEINSVKCKVGFTKKERCYFLRDGNLPLNTQLEKLQKTIFFRLGQYNQINGTMTIPP